MGKVWSEILVKKRKGVNNYYVFTNNEKAKKKKKKIDVRKFCIKINKINFRKEIKSEGTDCIFTNIQYNVQNEMGWFQLEDL